MAKLAQSFAKYLIHARLESKGVIERPDVIGAIFGQTEGLLGTDLDLRELQRTGRIGRIEVNVRTSRGRSSADVIIPSSMDAGETSLIAASLETIDKVGPCEAEIEVKKVEDVRTQKRKYVVERAKDILRSILDSGMPDSSKITESIKESVRSAEVVEWNGLSAGPEIEASDEIIIVEGRADVINLLRNGIKNAIAIEGSKIPPSVMELTRKKTTTAFLDGDRGGDLDLKRLLAIADIDYIARAEEGNEVEELTKKEIFKALREKVPVDQFGMKNKAEAEPAMPEDVGTEMKEFLGSLLEELVGTRAAYLVDSNKQILTKVPISEIGNVIDGFRNVYAIVFDGKINQDIVDLAASRSVPCVAAMDYKERVRGHIRMFTLSDLKN